MSFVQRFTVGGFGRGKVHRLQLVGGSTVCGKHPTDLWKFVYPQGYVIDDADTRCRVCFDGLLGEAV